MDVICPECGKRIANINRAAKQVTGWIEPRTQGGANHIRDPQPTGLFVHPRCLDGYLNPDKGITLTLDGRVVKS